MAKEGLQRCPTKHLLDIIVLVGDDCILGPLPPNPKRYPSLLAWHFVRQNPILYRHSSSKFAGVLFRSNPGAGRCERSRPFATSLWLFDIYPKSRLDAGTPDSENERLIHLKSTPIEKENHLNQTWIFGFHISFWVFGWLGGWEGFLCCLAVESWQFFSSFRLHLLGSLLMQPHVKLPTTSLHIGFRVLGAHPSISHMKGCK